MSSDIDQSYKPKPYFCDGCGSVIGIILRDAHRVTFLNVFRQVIRGSQIDLYLDFPDGGLRMFGHALYSIRELNDGDVLCQWCGRVCEWRASRPAVNKMLARLEKRNV